MPISLCMLTKNEEKTLARAINSVKDAVDEIIIVDTGSKDKTKQIAETFTNKIYDFEWNDNFADARNFSISKATKEWILVFDADETIKKEDLPKIKGLTKNKSCLGYRLIQKTHLNVSEIIHPNKIKGLETTSTTRSDMISEHVKNHPTKDSASKICRPSQRVVFNVEQSEAGRQVGNKKIRNNDKKIFYRGICRLFQNKKGIKFTYPIHETVRDSIKSVGGKIGKSGITIHHYPKYDNKKKDYYLNLLKEKINEYPESNARKERELELNY